MKGNAYKISVPSSRRREPRKTEGYPKTFPKGKKMDLPYPIMKLEHRLQYERECLEDVDAALEAGKPAFGSGSFDLAAGTSTFEPAGEAYDRRQREAIADRIGQLERAIAALRAA